MFNKYFCNVLEKKQSFVLPTAMEDDEKFRITAKEIARKNNIEYIGKVTCNAIESDKIWIKKFFLQYGRYILLYPINDGKITKIEWYETFGNKTKKVIDNEKAFLQITNLDEIMLQIVNLLDKYLDEEVIFCTEGFGLRLENKIVSNYIGRAKLVLTEDAVLNAKVKPDKFYTGKRYFINEFIDHFLGWNFGKVIRENTELKNACMNYNKRVIKKGIRRYAGDGINLKLNQDVKIFRFEET